jgi:hypothetical protein
MPRIAIIGSCITRDLWPIRGDAARDLAYISRTSLPSLLSAPIADFDPAPEPPPPLRRHQHNALVADLRKTALDRLLAFRPTHLIVDFIDERFDLLCAGDAIVTESWEFEASGYGRQAAFAHARRVPRLSAACDRLWGEAAAEFAALIRGTPLREAQLILHVSRWAEEMRTRTGRRRPRRAVAILEGRPADIAEHNALLAAYEARFEAVAPPMTRIDAGALRLADETHQWGVSPFHFTPEYYAEVWRQLEGLGVPRPVSVPDGAPSAPTA